MPAGGTDFCPAKRRGSSGEEDARRKECPLFLSGFVFTGRCQRVCLLICISYHLIQRLPMDIIDGPLSGVPFEKWSS